MGAKPKNGGQVMAQHKCPVLTCNTYTSTTKFMCPTHWRKVPQSLQSQIYAAYSKYLKAEGAKEGIEAGNSLRAVQAEALKAVEEK